MPTNQNVFILFQASHDSYIYSAQRERFDVSFDPHRKGKLLFYSAFNILIRKIILHLIPSSPQVYMTLRSISNNQSSDPNSIEWKHKLQGNEWDLQMKGSVQNIRGYYSFQLINNIRRKNDLKKQGSDGTESLRTSLYLPCFVLHKAKNHNWKRKNEKLIFYH